MTRTTHDAASPERAATSEGQDAAPRPQMAPPGVSPGLLHRKVAARAARRGVVNGGAEAPAAGSGDTFARATASGGGAVPHQQQMERAFGQDFSAVRAHTGRPGEMDAMGAEAATDGQNIAFASSDPSKEVVAHELTHVVQQRQSGGGGVQAKSSGVSSPNHASEREADAVASRAAAGERVSVSAAPDSGIHCLHGVAKGHKPIPDGSVVEILRSTLRQYQVKFSGKTFWVDRDRVTVSPESEPHEPPHEPPHVEQTLHVDAPPKDHGNGSQIAPVPQVEKSSNVQVGSPQVKPPTPKPSVETGSLSLGGTPKPTVDKPPTKPSPSLQDSTPKPSPEVPKTSLSLEVTKEPEPPTTPSMPGSGYVISRQLGDGSHHAAYELAGVSQWVLLENKHGSIEQTISNRTKAYSTFPDSIVAKMGGVVTAQKKDGGTVTGVLLEKMSGDMFHSTNQGWMRGLRKTVERWKGEGAEICRAKLQRLIVGMDLFIGAGQVVDDFQYWVTEDGSFKLSDVKSSQLGDVQKIHAELISCRRRVGEAYDQLTRSGGQQVTPPTPNAPKVQVESPQRAPSKPEPSSSLSLTPTVEDHDSHVEKEKQDKPEPPPDGTLRVESLPTINDPTTGLPVFKTPPDYIRITFNGQSLRVKAGQDFLNTEKSASYKADANAIRGANVVLFKPTIGKDSEADDVRVIGDGHHRFIWASFHGQPVAATEKKIGRLAPQPWSGLYFRGTPKNLQRT